MSTQDHQETIAANTSIVEALIKLALLSDFLRQNPGAEVTQAVSEQLDQQAKAQPSFVKEAVLYGMLSASAKANSYANAGAHWGCPDVATAKVVLGFASMGMDVMDMPL